MGYKNHDKGNTFPSSPNHGRSVYERGVDFFNGRPLIIDIGALESRHPIKLGTLCLEISLNKIFWLGG